jgi:hypothetical protein
MYTTQRNNCNILAADIKTERRQNSTNKRSSATCSHETAEHLLKHAANKQQQEAYNFSLPSKVNGLSKAQGQERS